MPTELHIFDFDGTIFRSPLDTPENHRKFEKHTGVPWLINKEQSRVLTKKLGYFVGMRRGWWGRQETLLPPLVPIPAPKDLFIESTVKDLIDSKNNPDAVTFILTGRHTGLKKFVLRICGEGGLVDIHSTYKYTDSISLSDKTHISNIDDNVHCFCLGDDGLHSNGVKPFETLPWKVWLVENFVSANPEIKKIIFWEDRIEHVEAFRELNGILAEEVIVNHVQSD